MDAETLPAVLRNFDEFGPSDRVRRIFQVSVQMESVLRFACTQCGKCCNRSPEVELSEASTLADVFVFRLMFRIHWLSSRPTDSTQAAKTTFYERKRLLSAFAARKYPVKARREVGAIDSTKYLVISALTLDTSPGACSALEEKRCGIYDRRPLSCRSVPLHYSRPEASAGTDLKTFVATAGYRCETGETAPIVINERRIVAPEIRAARTEALEVAERNRCWSEAIARRLKRTSSPDHSLPSLEEIEATAQLGAMTTSMRIAWQVAAEIGLFDAEECDRLVRVQLDTISRELSRVDCPPDARQTLTEMQSEYQHQLKSASKVAAS